MDERRKLLLIMNPKAGLMLAPKNMATIIESFSNEGYFSSVLMTTKRGDARDFAYQYGGDVDMIVVSGGDGTLNEVIDGLITGEYHTRLGYIPAGSTNDFANSIGLPKTISECVAAILRGKPQAVDIGSFNGRYFSYVASFGAFTSIAYSVPQNLKNIFGHAAYVMGGITELANLRSIHARVTADPGKPCEKVYEGDYVLGAVCNSKTIGGILSLKSLDVDMNDGLMEVLLIKMPKDLLDLNDIALSTLGGTFKSNQIESFSAKNLKIELDEGVHWTLDGEYEKGASVCEIKTIESAITMML